MKEVKVTCPKCGNCMTYKNYIMHFQEIFDTAYKLTKDTFIFLNDLCIYAISYDCCAERVDFEILTNKNGESYICPKYNPAHCDHFLLIGKKLF